MGRFVIAVVFLGGCIHPPPPLDPAALAAAPTPEPAATQDTAKPAAGAPAEPGPQDADSAKLEMMMADPDCAVEVVELLKAARGIWTDTKKYTCTYEVVINGQRYKYTRQLPRDRKREPGEVCERGLSNTANAVRQATHDCKDLTAADRPITGLVPIR